MTSLQQLLRLCGGASYVYDAEGKRITRSGSHAAEYTYDAEGNMITELSSNGAWLRSDLGHCRRN